MGDRRILRVAVTRSTVVGLARRLTLPLSLAAALTALLALFLSRALARGITAPITRLNLAEPLENDAYDEPTPLLLRLENQNETVTLTVQDTGIGIPLEHQNCVFERFYRVDKSHSKETGGTGLGLAIVKHAAAIHGASVELTSTPGSSSRFTVIFDKEFHGLA